MIPGESTARMPVSRRTAAIFAAIRRGEAIRDIAARFGTDRMTIEVYRKEMVGELAQEKPEDMIEHIENDMREWVWRLASEQKNIKEIHWETGLPYKDVRLCIDVGKLLGKVRTPKIIMAEYDAQHEDTILNAYDHGMAAKSIAEKYGIDSKAVYRVLNKYRYR